MKGQPFWIIALVLGVAACDRPAPATQGMRAMPPPKPMAGMPTAKPDLPANLPGTPTSGTTPAAPTPAESNPAVPDTAALIGEWTARLVIPEGQAQRLTNLLAQQEAQIKELGPPTLKLESNGTYSFTSFGLTYKGNFQRINTILELGVAEIGGKPLADAMKDGVTDAKGNKITLPATQSETLNLLINDESTEIVYDQGQNTTRMVFRKKS